MASCLKKDGHSRKKSKKQRSITDDAPRPVEMASFSGEGDALISSTSSGAGEPSSPSADPKRDSGVRDTKTEHIHSLGKLMKQRSQCEKDLPDRTETAWEELIPKILDSDLSNIKDSVKPIFEEAKQLLSVVIEHHLEPTRSRPSRKDDVVRVDSDKPDGPALDETDSSLPEAAIAFGDIAVPVSLMGGTTGVHGTSVYRKYLLLPGDCPPEVVFKCLTETWKFCQPQIIISVISGSVKNEKILKPLVSCIREVCADTKAWVITDGMHLGASRVISKELQHDTNIKLIGISNWGDLGLDEKVLLYGASVTKCNPSYYFYRKEYILQQHDVSDMLNPFQDVYLLMDNCQGQGIVHSRKTLVEYISERFSKYYTADAFMPVINIFVGGKKDEENKLLEQLASWSIEKFPVVLAAGSGQVPVMIEKIFKKLEYIKSRSAVVKPDLTDKEKETLTTEITDQAKQELFLTIMERRHYLTLLQLDKTGCDTTAVLKTFLKGKKQIESVTSALVAGSTNLLKAAMTREVDLVYDKNCCFMNRDTLGRLYQIMQSDKSGDSLPSLLFADSLENKSGKSNEDRKSLKPNTGDSEPLKDDENNSQTGEKVSNLDDDGKAATPDDTKTDNDPFSFVRYIFFLIIGYRYKLQFLPKENFEIGSSNQVWHLMLYAILTNKAIGIVKYLALLSECPLGALIFAHKLYGKLREKADRCLKRGLKTELGENADECLRMAENLIDQMHKEDKRKAQKLLRRPLPVGLGPKVTVLSLAAESNAKSFIHRPCCGNVIEDIWTKGLKSSTYHNVVAILLPIVSWFLLPGIVRGEEASDEKSHKCWAKRFYDTLAAFYSAPVTKFTTDVICHFVFLLFFTQFVVFDLFPVTSVYAIKRSEWIVYVCLLGKALDELLQLVYCTHTGPLCMEKEAGDGIKKDAKSQKNVETQKGDVLDGDVWSRKTRLIIKLKLYNIAFYFSEGTWNILDFVMIVMSLASVVCRFTISDVHFQAVRNLFAVTIVLYYARSLRYLYVFRHIGPRVIAITLMLKELVFFSFILVVFHVGFGVAFQSLLAPGKPLSEHVVADIMYRTYWQMYGELFLDDAASEMGREVGPYGCEYMKEHGRPDLDCHSYFPYLLLAVYLFISNVLLLNALIAIFGNTMNRVEEEAEMLWAYEKYQITHEYYYKWWFPPPFNLLGYPCYLLVCLVQWIRKCKFSNSEEGSSMEPQGTLPDSQIMVSDDLFLLKSVDDSLLQFEMDEARKILNSDKNSNPSVANKLTFIDEAGQLIQYTRTAAK